METLTTQQRIERGRLLALASLPFLSPEERLAGLKPQERLAGLRPEEILAIFKSEDLLATFKSQDLTNLLILLQQISQSDAQENGDSNIEKH